MISQLRKRDDTMNRSFLKIFFGFLVSFILIQISMGYASFPIEKDNAIPCNTLDIGTSDNDTITIINNITEYFIQNIEKNQTTYHLLYIPHYGIIPQVGKPLLPAKRFLLALPPTAKITELTMVKSYNHSLENYCIYPYQPPLPEKTLDNDTEFVINETFYSSNSYYPPEIVTISQPMTYYGLTVVQVTLNPVQFNPAQKKIRIYDTLQIDIHYDYFKEEKKVLPWTVQQACTAAILNPNMISHWYIFNKNSSIIREPHHSTLDITDTNNTADYLIITPDTFYHNITKLAEWKNQKGLQTKIVNLTQIYAEFPGNNTYSITNFINYTYNNWSKQPTYILLIGDVNYLPTNYGLSGCATDLHYTTLQGSDFLPDIMLGRLSIQNTSELDIIVDKLIGYEKTPYITETTWYRTATVFYGTDRPQWLQTANFIMNLLSLRGYRVNMWNENEGGTDRMATEINTGLSFLNYREHGSVTGWSMAGSGGFYNSDVEALTNGKKLPVVFSTTCNTGWFDDTGTDCFGEVWMKKNGGGSVAFLGSSRVSYTGYNDELAKGFYKAIFDDSLYSFSGIMNQGKLYMYNYYGSGYTTQLEYEMYNSFSDPSLDVWTTVPQILNVSHTSETYVGTNNVTVTVKSIVSIPGGINAWVTLWKEDEIFESLPTDSEGNATFVITPQSSGDITVTVTCHNYYPYVGTMMVYPPVNMSFSHGWNLITVPVDTSWTAESLGQNIEECTTVALYNASTQSFLTHVVGVPHDDFPIMDGKGYFVYVNNDNTFTAKGLPIMGANVSIQEDWNVIGWFNSNSTTAESLGQNISGTSVVTMFNSSSQAFLTHVVGVPSDNFTIEQGMGLFIYTTEASYWHGEG